MFVLGPLEIPAMLAGIIALVAGTACGGAATMTPDPIIGSRFFTDGTTRANAWRTKHKN